MTDDEPVTYWLRQLEAGDQEAARRLWQRYYREVVKLARARLGTTPRRVLDEEDVASNVLRSLYEGTARGQFTDLVNRHELWQLLAIITGRKVIDQQRLLNQQKRGGGRVRGDSALQGADGEGCIAGFDQLSGDSPPPEVQAVAADEYRRLMRLLDDDRLRQIAECKLEGYSNEDIGKRLGIAGRSVERKLQRIRQVWAGELSQ